MATDLGVLEPCARALEASVAAMKARTGPKGGAMRNDLLKAVVKQLRAAKISVTKKRDLAADILALCGIHAPAHERSLRRAVRSRGGVIRG